MQNLFYKLNKIEKKYANRDDKDAMMQKSQELMLVYKKYNIKPASGCLVTFIQLPLFFAFLEAIQRIPAILEETTFGLYLGTTPWQAITSGITALLVEQITTNATINIEE